MIYIRRAAAADGEAIWLIFQAVVAGGDTYVYAPDTSEAQARALWMPEGVSTCVAREQGEVVGTFLVRPNQPGHGPLCAGGGEGGKVHGNAV